MPSSITYVTSPVFELIAAMFRIHAHESLLSNKSREVAGRPLELTHWVEQKRAALPRELTEELAVFFDPESFFGLTLIRYAWDKRVFEHIDPFLESLEQESGLTLLSYFLQSGYGGNLRPDIHLLPEVTQFIDSSRWPQSEKWKITYLYLHPEETKQRLIRMLKQFYAYLKNELEELAVQQQESMEQMKSFIEEHGEKGLTQLLSGQTSTDSLEEIVISPSIFYYDCSMNSESESSLIFLYGTKQFQLKSELAVDKGRVINAFKILSDEKRIHIIRLLQQSPLYGYELAQRLDLSSSTVSHHLSSLASIGLVRASRKENRVYYEVQSQEIEKLLEQIKVTLIEQD